MPESLMENHKGVSSDTQAERKECHKGVMMHQQCEHSKEVGSSEECSPSLRLTARRFLVSSGGAVSMERWGQRQPAVD